MKFKKWSQFGSGDCKTAWHIRTCWKLSISYWAGPPKKLVWQWLRDLNY